jgi:hypothetical protein
VRTVETNAATNFADGRTPVVTAQDRYARDSEDNHLPHNHSIEKTSSGRGWRGAFSGAIVLDTKDMRWAPSWQVRGAGCFLHGA